MGVDSMPGDVYHGDMATHKKTKCQRCGEDFDAYIMPYYNPRFCNSCKPDVFRDREIALWRSKNAPEKKTRKSRVRVETPVEVKTSETSENVKLVENVKTPVVVNADPVKYQSLTCSGCGEVWQRPAKRGRAPKKCPECS